MDLIKEGYKVMKQYSPTDSDAEIIRRVLLSRNISPLLSTGMSPLATMCGRNDLLAILEENPQFSDTDTSRDASEAPLMNMQRNLRQIPNVRNLLSTLEARREIKICDIRRLRSRCGEIASAGDLVGVFLPGKNCGLGGTEY